MKRRAIGDVAHADGEWATLLLQALAKAFKSDLFTSACVCLAHS